MKPEPYAHDNARSKRRKMARPRDLLAWFMQGFRDEIPGQGGPHDKLHTRGVWRDSKHRGDVDGYQPVGGSQLGSPRMSDGFRRFIEDDPFGTEVAEYEGHKDIHNHYRTPMRAALARLAGRGTNGRGYLMARCLYILAATDGDLEQAMGHLHAFTRNEAGEVVADPEASVEYRRVIAEQALHQLYDRFHEEPPVYTVRQDAA